VSTWIVIPTYQEKGNIGAIIPAILAAAPAVSILVVDDNSPDGTAAVVREMIPSTPALHLLSRAKKEGLGPAYLAGFAEVMRLDPGVRSIVMMDADFSHDPQQLPGMLELARSHQLVVGSRYIPGGGAEGLKGWRLGLSMGGNVYARLVAGIPIHDCTAGFNVLRADLLAKVMARHVVASSGYAFQIELKYQIWRAGASPAEFPIQFRLRHQGKSKMSGAIVLEGILSPLRLRFRREHAPAMATAAGR